MPIQTAANVPVSTSQTLGFNTTTAILVRDVGSKVFLVDPSAAPFTLLTAKAGEQVAMNPRYEWYEKTLRPKISQVNNAAGYTAGDTTLTVDDGTVYQVGDLVRVLRTGEIMRVTANTATSITVTRGFGETAAAALLDNDDLLVVGSAHAEGADAGPPDEWQERHVFNFTQIFRRPFGVSATREASETYFGQTRPRLRAEKAIEHAIDIERAFLFGERRESVSGNTVIRSTRGFVKWATSNIKDAGGTLTEPELEDWLADVFKATGAGDTRVLFASAKVVSVIDQLGASRLQMVPSDRTYGLAVGQYFTSHGTLNIIKHRLLEFGLTGTQGFGDQAFAVDPKQLKMRPLSGRTTKLRVGVQSPGVDGWIDEYLTEAGLQFSLPEVHGILKNVTS